MSPKSKTEVYLHVLANLIASREKAVSDWMKFLATVQAGLAVGFGFVMFQGRPALLASGLLKLLVTMIPLFAILLAVGTYLIIRRERIWQQWFNLKVQVLTGTAIFPNGYFTSKYRDRRTPHGPNDMHPGRITRTLSVMIGILVVTWLVVGGFAYESIGASPPRNLCSNVVGESKVVSSGLYTFLH